jgi:hypothetical protein
MIDIRKMLEQEEDSECLNPDIEVEKLREALLVYRNPDKFEPDDVLRLRPAMRTYMNPTPGFPAIFVRYLTTEERDFTEGSGEEDALIATLVDDVFCVYRVASFRFELYPELQRSVSDVV